MAPFEQQRARVRVNQVRVGGLSLEVQPGIKKKKD